MKGRQTPTASHVPTSRHHSGRDAAQLAAAYGLELDPWQQRVLTAGLGERADGNWTVRQVGLSVPRQNGKTAIFEARELAGLLLFGEELIIHSAHLVATALEAFHRIKAYFENYDDLRRKVKRIREANGEQAVEMMTGQRLMFRARARGGGRGMSPDVLMLDEAQILPEKAWLTAWPSVSARPNPQAWLAGTPPTAEDDAEVFTRLRSAALEQSAPSVAWLEWAADAGEDISLPRTWAKANPAYPLRISREAVESELASLSPDGFARERLGVWPAGSVATVIPTNTWNSRVDAGPPDGTPPDALAVDMSHDRIVATAGCWRTGDDSVHVEALAVDTAPDALAAADMLAGQAGRRIPIVVDTASPAASLVPILKAKRCRVVQTSAADMVKACGMFYDDTVAGRLTHPGQGRLDEALAGARKRPIRDAGGWGWDRRDPTVNIAPLVAATLARFGAAVTKPRRATGRTASNRRAVCI